jgi:hypothetical protein
MRRRESQPLVCMSGPFAADEFDIGRNPPYKSSMKPHSLTVLVLVVSFAASSAQVHARQPTGYDDYSPDSMAADAGIARPLYFGATLIGMGLFVATLPITLVSGSTKKAAKSLVAYPAHMAFTRKLGKLSEIDK